jgi:lipoprotein NlpD
MLAAAVLAGCAAPSGRRAPVIDHSFSRNSTAVAAAMPVQRERMQHEKDWRPQVYVVQKGDTLYSIALNFGFDYRDLAELNGIQNPAVIQVGQEIRLFPAAGAVKQTTEAGAVTIKSQPVVSKLPYSEQAVAQIEKMQSEPLKVVEVKPLPQVKQSVAMAAAGGEDDESVQWGMPASGRVIADFSEGDNRKGIDITGKLGQPVFASAAGKVVYSGSGLRGYGNLVIIKHNSTYLSAYAHNSKILVKEGQMVSKGQKIAEMGSSDASRIALHFEIRRLGKPVDPAKYLPLPKS